MALRTRAVLLSINVQLYAEEPLVFFAGVWCISGFALPVGVVELLDS